MNKNEIEAMLDEIGISVHMSGYKYLIEMLILKDKIDYSEKFEIVKNYEIVAKKFCQKPHNIERAIRYITIKNAKQIKDFFGVSYKITNLNFVELLHRHMKKGGK